MKAEFEKANQNVKIEHWHMGSGGTSGPVATPTSSSPSS